MDKTLSSCKVKKEATIYAQRPEKSEKYERRKRYGKGWDNEPVLKKRMREEREEKRAEKKALREATKRTSCEVVENTTSPTPEIDGDAQASSEFASDDGAGDRMEVEAQGDFSDAGEEDAQGLSQEVAEEQQDEQQAEEEEREERPTREVEQDDPFADEDSDKENREPQALAPVVENRANDHPPEEWLAFDESNSGLGLDLQEEVIEF